MSKTVYVDNTIYRKESKQFPNVKYRFNLANVVIHSMYTIYHSDRSRSRNERKMKMSTIGIILLSIATLIVADIVMYIVLGAIEKHWEKKFKEDKDDER